MDNDRRELLLLWPGRALPVLAGLVVVAVFYRTLASPGAFPALNDLVFFHLPLRAEFGALARQGIPLWNPMIHGGQPILSNPNYGAFYPPSWLVLVLPTILALKILILGHAGFAFAGAWKLARSLGCTRAPALLAAVGFVGAGTAVSSVNLLNFFCALSWLPWILLWTEEAFGTGAKEGRRVAVSLAASGVAAQLLAGEPVVATAGALAVAAWVMPQMAGPGLAAGDRMAIVKPLLLILGLSIGLGAVQAVPTLVHILGTARTAADSQSLMAWSMPPDRLVEFFFPHWLGDPMLSPDGLYAGDVLYEKGYPYLLSTYPGLLLTILACCAAATLPIRRRWSLVLLAGIGLFLALGRHNPVYAGLLVHLPPFAWLRYPEKFLVLTTTAIPFAAALGWNRLLDRTDQDPKTFRWAASAFAVAVLAGALWRAVDLVDTAGAADVLSAYLGRETLLVGLLAVAAFAVVWLHRWRSRFPGLLVAAVLGLALLDLSFAHRRLVPRLSNELLEESSQAQTLAGKKERVFPNSGARPDVGYTAFRAAPSEEAPWIRQKIDLLEPYVGTLWGVHYALHSDYDLMLTEPASRALELWRRVASARSEPGPEAARVLGAWNVGTLIALRPAAEQRAEHEATGRRPHPAQWFGNPDVLPRYRFVPAAGFYPLVDQAVAAAEHRQFDMAIREEVVAGHEQAGGLRSFDEGALVTGHDVLHDGVVVRYQAQSPALLVAAVTYDSAWTARAGGGPVPVFQTALGQTAIEVPAAPAGEMRLRYGTPWPWLGAIVSLVTASGCAWWIRRLNKVPRRGSSRL